MVLVFRGTKVSNFLCLPEASYLVLQDPSTQGFPWCWETQIFFLLYSLE